MDDSPAAAAERVRDLLRKDILSGKLLPGTRLKEHSLSEQLRVSRNTVRDGIRLLSGDGLVTTQRNAGSTVTTLTERDARDIYAVRRALEVPAITASAAATEESMAAMQDACALMLDAAERGEWSEAGTLSLIYHQSIVGFHGSARLSEFFESILAQLRLVFFVMSDEPAFQRTWPTRDVAIAQLIVAGRRDEAVASMRQYLDDSEAMVIDAIRLNASAEHSRAEQSRRVRA